MWMSLLVSKFLDDPKAVGTVSSLDGLEILPLQNGADELPNGRLVIKDKASCVPCLFGRRVGTRRFRTIAD